MPYQWERDPARGHLGALARCCRVRSRGLPDGSAESFPDGVGMPAVPDGAQHSTRNPVAPSSEIKRKGTSNTQRQRVPTILGTSIVTPWLALPGHSFVLVVPSITNGRSGSGHALREVVQCPGVKLGTRAVRWISSVLDLDAEVNV